MLEFISIEDLNKDDKEWFEGRVAGQIPKFRFLKIMGISYFDIEKEDLEVRISTLVIQYNEDEQPEDDSIGNWLNNDLVLLHEYAKSLEDEGNPEAVILYGWDEYFLIFTSYC